jgi:hypothetical protein
MKTSVGNSLGFFISCGLLLAVPTKTLRAEEVTVFACEDDLVEIPRPAVISDFETEDRELTLLIYKPGQNMGALNTGDIDLSSIAKKALAEDQSEAPFFGPGYEFILRDTKGQHFIAFFEYEKGHKTFRGFRAALAPLNDLGSKGAVFVGHPYQGVVFDKEILKQLKAFADRLPEKKEKEEAETKEQK